jgi:hypothetical protein
MANEESRKPAGHVWPWLHVLAFLAFAVMVVLSNRLDWDAFYAFFEVDRRSWLHDHQPPLWSYQLCAGSTRLGDPQSFGLSPLFLPALVVGAFCGAKVLVVIATLAGWLALRRTLAVLFPTLDRPTASTLALFFVLGDFFLWHAHAGHITFSLIPLSFIVVERGVRFARGGFTWLDALWLTGAAAGILSAGFYPVMVFFLIPAGICLALPALALRLGRWPGWAATGRMLLALAAALGLSAHKWLSVGRYQKEFPRTLDAHHVAEGGIGLLQTLAYQLSPTWKYDFWLAPSDWGPWDVWEYSMCSAISFLAVALLFRGWGLRTASRKALLFFAIALGLCLSFFLPDDSPLSLHHLLNRILYAGSVRVIGRYGAILQMLLLLFVAFRLSNDEGLRRWARRWLLPLGMFITTLNLGLLIANGDVTAAVAVAGQAKAAPDLMRTERIVPLRTVEPAKSKPYRVPSSHMYAAIAAGEIVPNCYQPLRRPRTISTERRVLGAEANVGQSLDLVDKSFGPVSEACVRSVGVTQNHIQFDRAVCPSNLCLNLNAANSVDADFAVDEQRRRVCLRP